MRQSALRRPVASAYLHAHGVDVRIARIFNTYGPRMRIDDGRVVPAFMTQAILGEPLTVYGDGSQTRSFCHVDDTVEGIYRLLTYGREGSEELVVNIGNPEEITVSQLAEEVIRLTGSASKVVIHPLPKDDPRVRRPDITRARRLLGWEPKVSCLDGLASVVPYFKHALEPAVR